MYKTGIIMYSWINEGGVEHVSGAKKMLLSLSVFTLYIQGRDYRTKAKTHFVELSTLIC